MTLRRRTSALVTSAAIAASLTAAAAASAGPPAWEPSPLRVAHGDIVDAEGRTVLLRGVNVNQLADYAVNDPALPTVVPLTRDDFAQMASLGFTVARLNVSWSALEPRPGAFDTGYAAKSGTRSATPPTTACTRCWTCTRTRGARPSAHRPVPRARPSCSGHAAGTARPPGPR